MSITGSIYKASKEELERYKNKITWNPDFENPSLFLDSFFYDIFEILTKYSDYSKYEMTPIIEGKNLIRKDEVTIGFSLENEVKYLNSILDKINLEKFEEYFINALSDNESYVYHFRNEQIYLDGIRNYFKQMKTYYSEASNEDKCLLHIIG